jgi:hypothetical protein
MSESTAQMDTESYIMVDGQKFDVDETSIYFKKTYVRTEKPFPALNLKYRYPNDDSNLLVIVTEKGATGVRRKIISGKRDGQFVCGSKIVHLNHFVSSKAQKIRVVIGLQHECNAYNEFPENYEYSDEENKRLFTHVFVDGERVNAFPQPFEKTYLKNTCGLFPTIHVEFRCNGYGNNPKLIVYCNDVDDFKFIFVHFTKKNGRESYRGQKYINLNDYVSNSDVDWIRIIIGFEGKFYGKEYRFPLPIE